MKLARLPPAQRCRSNLVHRPAISGPHGCRLKHVGPAQLPFRSSRLQGRSCSYVMPRLGFTKQSNLTVSVSSSGAVPNDAASDDEDEQIGGEGEADSEGLDFDFDGDWSKLGIPTTDEEFAELSYVDQLNYQYGNGFVSFSEGEGGLPRAFLCHPNGQGLEVYLHGACITKWLTPGLDDVLFLRPDSKFDPAFGINSGLPVHFPQHRDGPLPENGFARFLPWDVVDAGLTDAPDPAPFIVLRLMDSDETRKYWPHKFELLYKITLQLDDAFPNIEPETYGQELGTTEFPEPPPMSGMGGSMEDEEADEDENDEEDEDPRSARQRRTDAFNAQLRANLRQEAEAAMVGGEDEEGEGEAQPARVQAQGKATAKEGAEEWQQEDEDEQRGGEGEEGEADEDEEWGDGEGLEGEESEEGGEWEEEDFELWEDSDETPENGRKLGLKLEFIVVNGDEEGSPPMEFQLGVMPHFAVTDLIEDGNFIRVLGLGGSMTMHYEHDPRYPILSSFTEDFLHYRGYTDTVFINAHKADIYLCPGKRTHVKMTMREGFRDAFAYHPGGQIETAEAFDRHFVALGAAKSVLPQRLEAGHAWHAELLLEHVNGKWPDPVFETDSEESSWPIPTLAESLKEERLQSGLPDGEDDNDFVDDDDDEIYGVDEADDGGGDGSDVTTDEGTY